MTRAHRILFAAAFLIAVSAAVTWAVGEGPWDCEWEGTCDSQFRCLRGSACADWEHLWGTSDPDEWEHLWGASVVPVSWEQGFEEGTGCINKTGVPETDVSVTGTGLDCDYAGVGMTEGSYALDLTGANGVAYVKNYDLGTAAFATEPLVYFDLDFTKLNASPGPPVVAFFFRGLENSGVNLTYPNLAYKENIFNFDWMVFACSGVSATQSATLFGVNPKTFRVQIDWTQAAGSTQYVRIYWPGNPTPAFSGSCVSSPATSIDGVLSGFYNASNNNWVIDNIQLSNLPIDTGF